MSPSPSVSPRWGKTCTPPHEDCAPPSFFDKGPVFPSSPWPVGYEWCPQSPWRQRDLFSGTQRDLLILCDIGETLWHGEQFPPLLFLFPLFHHARCFGRHLSPMSPHRAGHRDPASRVPFPPFVPFRKGNAPIGRNRAPSSYEYSNFLKLSALLFSPAALFQRWFSRRETSFPFRRCQYYSFPLSKRIPSCSMSLASPVV